MRRGILVLELCLLPVLLLASEAVSASHPNNSILPEPPPPTRYGLTVLRADDDRFLQPPPELTAPPGSLDAYRAAVAEVELGNGPYAAELVEPLADMARTLQASGRYLDATAQYRRALHLTRVNGGLYDDAQIPLLEQLAASQVAMGLLEQANDTYEYLYRVQRQVYPADSEELLAATRSYSERKRQAYLAGFGFETYVHLLKMHRVNSAVVERIASGDEADVMQVPHLYQRMRSEYLMSRYEGEADPVFQVRQSSGIAGGDYGPGDDLDWERFRILKKHNFRNGRKTLEQVVEILEAQNPVDIQALAHAKIALGDWYMWWDRPANARENYEEAWALWATDDLPGTDPQQLFQQPVELPEEQVFQPGPRPEEIQLNARAVVTFKVSRLGQARNIDFQVVEAESEDKVETARLALLKMLKNFRFRPMLLGGEVVDSDPIQREYRFVY